MQAPASAPQYAAPAGVGGAHRGPAPQIGTMSSGGGSIPDAHFNKPLLFRINGVVRRTSNYEKDASGNKIEFDAPIVDYLVFDEAAGNIEEVRGVTIMQKNIRRDLVEKYVAGEQAVAAIATHHRNPESAYSNAAKVLRPLDDENTTYGAEWTISTLRDVAIDEYHWWDRG
ncbi:hypothetical protein B8W67_16875 [Mycolicibacillus koreensis]|uniref:Uncharacterized protein n=1 Tax=Mycolicibacillus koreensis TaxID=1069220 RepID=A0AA91PBW9_9MYCO|nr:hypothetical protein B8W67_16875 [Mycolicibacillus koreensis]